MPSVSPSITTMIRMDHTHVFAAFHRYHADSPWWRKRAIVELACTALEIHAQLEEEIFYPALAEALPGDDTLAKSKPEHDKMREDIAKLRAMGPDDAAYDARFMQLMREVIHHVADEETVLLPTAERALGSRLSELGQRMTKRRMQLVAQKNPTSIAVNTMGTFPLASLALVSLGAFAIAHCLRPSSSRRADRYA
ncbi:hemerythrin domain-containing protein [Caballeronia sp. Lep1P3]|uniref:hemerythrin domain-containing protein n=1 Tax=Caballeronia sp. Lep1P3 TaxID=2878150 RepID=UPI001FD5B70F|nr:hemerythrin domain-containing protein [Caballeronia sp. Lep1P3]